MEYHRPKKSTFVAFKFNFGNFIFENKIFLIILSACLFIGFLTGIFTAIKYNNGAAINFNNYSITEYLKGNLGSLSLFLSRMLSYECVLIIIYFCCFHFSLIIVNFLVIGYRAYLLGLNCTLIIVMFGLGGIATSILIVIPCQLCILFLLIIFSSFSARRALFCRKYGKGYKDTLLPQLLVFTVIITIINIVETLLLTIFSSRLILVI